MLECMNQCDCLESRRGEISGRIHLPKPTGEKEKMYSILSVISNNDIVLIDARQYDVL